MNKGHLYIVLLAVLSVILFFSCGETNEGEWSGDMTINSITMDGEPGVVDNELATLTFELPPEQSYSEVTLEADLPDGLDVIYYKHDEDSVIDYYGTAFYDKGVISDIVDTSYLYAIVFPSNETEWPPDQKKEYRIYVSNKLNALIEEFKFEMLSPDVVGDIDEDNYTIDLLVPNGTDVTGLIPTITLSDSCTVSPNSGIVQNFTDSVTYTVTSVDDVVNEYAVIVTVDTVSAE